MIVGMIISNSQVCMLRFSLWEKKKKKKKKSLQYLGNEDIYSVDEDMVEQI